MKKYLALLLILSMSLYASNVFKNKWEKNPRGDSNFLQGNGYVIFNYDKTDSYLNSQNENILLSSLQKQACKIASADISRGTKVIYNYTYRDGTITVVVDSCY